MHTTSPSPTWVPKVARLPLQVTRPASIHLSASRLEQAPVSLMNLLSLNGLWASSVGAQECADFLCQALCCRVERLLPVVGKIEDQSLLPDHHRGAPVSGGAGQHQASHEFP